MCEIGKKAPSILHQLLRQEQAIGIPPEFQVLSSRERFLQFHCK